MKKLLVLAALTIAMSLFMSSCKDDTPAGPSEVAYGEMTATVGGNNWAAQNAVYYSGLGLVSGIQQVGGLSNIMDVNSISVDLFETAGTPEAKTYRAICFYQESRGLTPNSKVDTWTDINGTCVVTEVTNTSVKGTFTFKGTHDTDGSTKSISGKFFTKRQ